MHAPNTVLIGLGQLGAADSAPPIRRGQLDAANSTSGQFGAGPTRRDGDINFQLQSACARMIPALAFVPLQDLEAAFQELSDKSPPELQPVLDWLEDNYIGRPNRRRRCPPVFPHEMWTVHDRVVQHLDRTNNHAEAAHQRIQAEFQMDHPTLWKFIGGLKKVQKGRDVFHEQLVAGHAPPRKLRRYQLCDQRIKRSVQNYANYGMMDCLRELAHNFEMN